MEKNEYLDSKLNEVIGSILKREREKQNLSLEELSNRMNNKIIRQNLHNYENQTLSLFHLPIKSIT